MLEDLDLSGIQEENARKFVKIFLNQIQIEELSAGLRDARVEIQKLRDEINRLKGEQGKPGIKANITQSVANHSSEKERRKPRVRHKKSKKEGIVVNHEEVVRVKRESLPALADLPAEYEGQFGPGIKALVLTLYFGGQMTEPRILEFLGYAGIQISPGQISNLLTKRQEEFHAKNDAVFEAGMNSSPYQHLDDTPTRVNGQNQYCQTLCNEVYTSYHTRAHKDRLTVLDVLRNGRARIFRLNAEALSYLEDFPLSKITRQILQS